MIAQFDAWMNGRGYKVYTVGENDINSHLLTQKVLVKSGASREYCYFPGT